MAWKCCLQSPVYSTCMMASNIVLDYENQSFESLMKQCAYDGLVCSCSCNGVVYVIDSQSGGIRCSLQLPNEVFSSPVVVNNRIIVGCRDESLYCIDISLEKQS